jgi:hypothetical protein
MEENIIEKLNLTKKEVLSVINQWYAYDICDLIQNEDGFELDEILQDIYDDTEDEEKADFEVE